MREIPSSADGSEMAGIVLMHSVHCADLKETLVSSHLPQEQEPADNIYVFLCLAQHTLLLGERECVLQGVKSVKM